MNELVIDFKLNTVKGILANASALKDKGLLLEKEIGLEPIYAMLSMGKSITDLALSLGMSVFELKFILQRTPQHSRQYMNAMATKLADKSIKVLDVFSDLQDMDQETNAAAKYHSSALDRSLRILNAPDTTHSSEKIIVNNTIVVRNKDDIPSMPDGLENIIEGENVNT